ncbi:DUF262 domain-containing protein [Cupriavidus gilardii]|nr:DUF262 domain-containing protein [Cupriavidus gilardii]MCT9055984.1 DUF262 domain-containing protein [Cupriavidus gilardii]
MLDGQQRLTSLSAVIRGGPVSVRGRRRPADLLFNSDHPDQLAVVTEVEENGGDEDDVDDDSNRLVTKRTRPSAQACCKPRAVS